MKNTNKKPYTFRLNHKVNNDLSKLASAFKLDRTAMLEYIITTYASMWVNEDERGVVDNET